MTIASQTKVRPAEPLDTRLIRLFIQNWPFPRGRWLLMRFFRRALRGRSFVMMIEPQVFAWAELNDRVSEWYFMYGMDRDPVMRLFRRLISAGDTVFDIGANAGYWALGASVRVGSQGKVFAFEPVPANLTRLKRNLALNQIEHVRCEPIALSNRIGETVFYATAGPNSGLGRLAAREESDVRIRVNQMTIDGYCEEHDLTNVDLIKVDVEGAEALVFEGACQTLSAADGPAIMFELIDTLMPAFESSPVRVISMLNRYGYEVFRFDGRRLTKVAPAAGEVKHADLIALKPYHFERYAVLRGLSES